VPTLVGILLFHGVLYPPGFANLRAVVLTGVKPMNLMRCE